MSKAKRYLIILIGFAVGTVLAPILFTGLFIVVAFVVTQLGLGG